LRAVANREQFRGTTPEEEAAWLRTILARQLAEELRKLHTHKRDIGLEVSLERELGASSARLEAWLCGDDSTPSQRAQRHEELLHLAAGLMRLPEDLRDAVELHHLHGLTVSDVAEQMGRSRAGVAGLLRRGLAELRAFLDEDVACPTPTRGTTKNNDSMT
jgi:RNA polymerase sigma-70 factor (ECF subfamily)